MIGIRCAARRSSAAASETVQQFDPLHDCAGAVRTTRMMRCKSSPQTCAHAMRGGVRAWKVPHGVWERPRKQSSIVEADGDGRRRIHRCALMHVISVRQ